MAFVVVPLAGIGTMDDPIVPKYVTTLGITWQWRDLPSNWGVVWSPDITQAQLDAIALNADAIVVPPLGNPIALAATQSALEALNVPAQWLQADMTYRTVLRVIVGMANFMQTCAGMGLTIVLAGNLDRTYASLPQNARNVLPVAAATLGLDTSDVIGSTTVREMLRMMGQQFAAGRTIKLGGL